jgi:TolB protein
MVLSGVLLLVPARAGAIAGSGAIAFVSGRDGGVYVVNAGGGGYARLVADAQAPQWSPDGGLLLFERGDDVNVKDLYLFDVATGQERLVASSVFTEAATWSHSGREIAFTVPGPEAWVVAAEGGPPRRVSSGNGYNPVWSPDGSRLAYLRWSQSGNALYIVNADGGSERKLAEDPDGLSYPVWSPDGAELAFVKGGALLVTTVDTGATRLVQNDVAGRNDVDDGAPPLWSPDGSTIAFTRESGPDDNEVLLYAVDRDGASSRKLSARTVNWSSFSWAPSFWGIAWSPDSSRIAFNDDRGGTVIARADGGGDVRIPPPASFGGFRLDWSPDGSTLAFADEDIWLVNADGSHLRPATRTARYGYNNLSPDWQPQGLAAEDLGGTVVDPALPTDSVVQGKTLQTTSEIAMLAADGSRVAVTYTNGDNCMEIWNVPTGSLSRIPGACDPLELTLGGSRAGWLTYEQGISLYLGIDTATAEMPRPAGVYGAAVVYGLKGEAGVGDLRAQGSLMVFDGWAQKGGGCPDPGCFRNNKTRGTLYRLVGHRVRAIRRERVGLTALAVDHGRIVVRRSDGPLELLNANGRLLQQIPFAPDAAIEAALSGSHLTVSTRSTMAVYNTSSGRLLHTWRVPANSALAGATNGIAAYSQGHTIHLIRLTDGRRRRLTPPGVGPIHVRLTQAGLFYAYKIPSADMKGRIAFEPLAQLLARFRVAMPPG